MPEPTDFVDKIIEGFRSLRKRPHFDVLVEQFEAGEVSFVVDCKGIQIYVDEEVAPGSHDTDFPTS
jgi:hypothetical protein